MKPELKSCVHCGHEAHFGEVHEEGSENDGGEFIECTNPQCGMSTLLMFPTMDEVKSLLAERWNARAGNEQIDQRRLSLGEEVHCIAGAVAPPPQMPDSTNDAPGG